MTGNLVSSVVDIPDEVRIVLGNPPEDKKGRSHIVLGQHIENRMGIFFYAALIPVPVSKLDYIGKSGNHIIIFHVDGKRVKHGTEPRRLSCYESCAS
jgi:hypothetical protein